MTGLRAWQRGAAGSDSTLTRLGAQRRLLTTVAAAEPKMGSAGKMPRSAFTLQAIRKAARYDQPGRAAVKFDPSARSEPRPVVAHVTE